ncbi:MAG: hypothetical protein GY913_25680 [Proteobacteria bacterium]|nr:hypothetical protein [Pseudomonadota bacterium]MCP4920306.1 hypothetical protein [Pseudomonadota bacterium]
MADLNEKHLDVRVIETYVARGIVSQDQVDAHLESLEDCAELAEETETRMVASAPDEDE